jgi:hypothetical protein
VLSEHLQLRPRGRRLQLQQPLHDYGHAAAASTTAAVLLEELKMELFFMRAGLSPFQNWYHASELADDTVFYDVVGFQHDPEDIIWLI